VVVGARRSIRARDIHPRQHLVGHAEGAVDSRELFRSQRRIARGIDGAAWLGLALERRTGRERRFFEVAGVPDGLIKRWSQRTEVIERAAREFRAVTVARPAQVSWPACRSRQRGTNTATAQIESGRVACVACSPTPFTCIRSGPGRAPAVAPDEQTVVILVSSSRGRPGRLSRSRSGADHAAVRCQPARQVGVGRFVAAAPAPINETPRGQPSRMPPRER